MLAILYIWAVLAQPDLAAPQVLFFVASDCPISNGYAPEIQRLCAEYGRRGVRCSLVYEDVAIDPAAMRKHLDEYRYGGMPAAIDRDRSLARRAGASITPEAVLIDATGNTRYRGRIDNRYAELGKPRRVVTVHDLRDALDAVLAGKPVAHPETTALGCHIATSTRDLPLGGQILFLARVSSFQRTHVQETRSDPTFSDTIAPIVYANCVTCHRPGQAAPFSLISYEDVAKRAQLITKVTKSRYMPPWHAAHGYGEFADERRLTDEQIAVIGEWVKRGMPRGDTRSMPKVPEFPDGWQLGKPDLILEMPAGFQVPADGPDIYRNFVLPTGLVEDKWVRAVEFHPSARKAVHHAIFSFIRGGAVKAVATDGQPGFRGGMPVALIPGFAPAGELGSWAVGGTPRFLPEGLARSIGKGSDFILQVHFHPTGKPEVEKSTVGIYFADTPPARRLRTPSIPGFFGFMAGIDIPPGEKNYTITGRMTTGADMKLYSVMAHAHYLGKEIKATATLPDGTIQPLLWIQDWDFNWQDRYDYKQPVLLPQGTRVDVTITYDNSADNPRNPCNPPRRVRWGVQSLDEMGTVSFLMVAVNAEDEAKLQQQGGAMLKAAIAQVANGEKFKEYLAQQKRFMAEADGEAAVGCAAGEK